MKPLLIALTLALTALPATAHEAAKGPNGGRIADAGSYHVELVARGDALEAFLTDGQEKPVAPAGFKGTALFVVDGKPQRISLEPEGARLAGKSSIPLPASPKGAVQITSPDGKTASARFN